MVRRSTLLLSVLSLCALASPALPALGQTISFVDASGAAAATYVEGSRAFVRVEDAAADVSPTPDTVQVRLTSARGGDEEALTLTETGPRTGVFRGDLPLAPAGFAQPGVLETAVDPDPPYGRDTIRAEYGPASATATMVGSRLQFLDVYGRPASRLVAGQPVRVRLTDSLENNPQYQDGAFVTLTSASGDQEGLVLQETGFDTGVFEGEMPSSASPVIYNDGVLEAYPLDPAGQAISVEHPDVDAPTLATAGATLPGESIELVDAQGRPAAEYLESTRVYVEVRTPRSGSSTPGTLQAQVRADLSGDVETVTLRETGGGTGVFQGSVPMRRGPALAQNGILETTESESGPPYRFDTVRASFGANGATDAVPTLGSLTSFRDGYGNEVSAYAAGAPVTVRVEDHNFNDPGAIDSVQATVQSLTTGDAERLTLYEVARDSGVFEAVLPTAAGAPPSLFDGRLQVSTGDTLQAMHVDAFPQLASGALARIDPLSIGFVDEAGRPTGELLEGAQVRVRVASAMSNRNPSQVETLQALLQTRFGGDQETVQLTETGPDTGVFEGAIPSSFGPGSPGDGILEESNGGPPAFVVEEVTALLPPATAVAHTVSSRMTFLDEFGRETSTTPLGGPVRLRLVYPAANDPNYQDSFYIPLQVGGDQEGIVLQETGFDTGVFEGAIDSSSGAAVVNSGHLEGSVGQTITAELQNFNYPSVTRTQAVFTGGQVSFVAGAGQLATAVLEGTQARVRVVDHGADVDPSQADRVTVDLSTELSGDAESLTLTETGPQTGVFEGAIPVRHGPVLQHSGAVEPGEDAGPPHQFDTIHAIYAASSGGGVSTAAVGTLNSRVWFLDAYGQVTSRYPERTRAYVRVEDHRFDDPGAVDRVYAVVRSSTGDQESVELVETGLSTGIFEGSLALDSAGSPAADGKLQAGPGAGITAERDTGYTAEPAQAWIDPLSISFVDESGLPTAELLEGGLVRLRAVSLGSNQDPSQVETLQAVLRTRFGGDQETVQLTETGPDTGLFEGTLPSRFGPGSPGNGSLEESNGGPPAFVVEEVTALLPPASAMAHTVSSRMTFIDELGQATSSVPLGGPVRLRLVYPSLNDPQYQDSIYIPVQVGGDQEGIILTETGLDTGLFEGSIDSVSGAAIVNSGVLEGSVGQTITAELQNFNYPSVTRAQAVFTDASTTTGHRVWFLDASGTVVQSYGERSRVYVRLEDHNSGDPGAVDRRYIQLTSSSGDQELLAVDETGVATGIYEGSILLASAAPAPNDGRLQARPDEVITADLQGAQFPAPARARIFEVPFLPPTLSFLNLRGQSVESYSLRATVRIEIDDPARVGAGSLTVALESLFTGDAETMPMTETSPGVFLGSMPSTEAAGASGDGVITAAAGQVIRMNYNGATVTVRFLSNQSPQAAPDRADTMKGQPVNFNVLANDSDPEGGPLTVGGVTPPSFGSVVINPDGTLTYTPVPTFLGIDAFSYIAVDPQGGEASGTVNVYVSNNHPPVANDDSGSMNRGGSLTIDVLANDTDPDGDPLRVIQVSGPVVINPDKTVTYTPRPTFSGLDSFDYVVADGREGLATGHVHVFVNAPPTANTDAATVAEDQTVQIAVLSNDTDDQSPGFLTVASVTQGAHGAVAINPDKTVSYTPAANFNGTDSFAYTITDAYNSTSTSTATVTITPVNDPPVTGADAATVAEDGSVDVAVLANDSDADGDALTVTAVTQGPHGAVVINPDKAVKYTPAANYNGADAFTYTVSDGHGGTAVGTVTVTITPVNDAPVANADAATVTEDGSVNVAVLANDTDVDGDTLSVASVTQGVHGTVTINPDGMVRYTPAANYNGADAFTYTVSDGHGGTATGTVAVTVTAVNDPPVANPDTATLNEDTLVRIAVLANDSDPDGDALTVIAVTQGTQGGGVLINADGTVTYNTKPDYNGPDSFTYTVSDGHGGTAVGSVTVTVIPVNDAPVAVSDGAIVAEDGSVTIDVLANDHDPDGDPLHIYHYLPPTHGSLTLNPDNTFTYTPGPNFHGVDEFSYSAADPSGYIGSARVFLQVTSVNDPPVVAPDAATVAEDGSVAVNVLANDSDVDGDALTVTAVTQGPHGAVVINPDKTVKYTPAANYNGADAFTYTVSDGHGGTAVGTVTVTITPVNDAPVANADAATVAEDGGVNVAVLANDMDVDGDTLSVASVTQGSHGTAVINPDGTVRYTPAANYNGADAFTYTVSDGHGGTATGTVTINVSAVNDGPIANADAASVAEDGTVAIPVLLNDTDAEGDTLTVASITQAAHGSAAINPDGTVRYTPAANYNGADAFTYTISDGNGGTASALVTIAVTPVDDPPVAGNDAATVVAGSPVTVAVLANDVDIDGPALAVTGVTQGAHGTVAINGDQTVTYTAGLYVGPDSFTYTVSDGAGGAATATVTVNVTAPQRVAAGIQARYDFNEGSGATIQDTSGVGTPLNLTIGKPAAVSWLSGGLAVNASAAIESAGKATKIIDAVEGSNSITVEAWLQPASLTLTGPARVLLMSKNPAQRNLVFGQSGGRYETQLKTSTGAPSLQSPANSLSLSLTHVVYTRSNSGQAVYYINGVQVSSQAASGSLSAWGSDQKLTLADGWKGDYFLLAVYGRDLTGAEVQQNYLAGVNGN